MKPKIGIIGCGYWGKNLVRNFYQLGALHAICDVNSTALQEHLLQYKGIQGFDDPQKMRSNPSHLCNPLLSDVIREVKQ